MSETSKIKIYRSNGVPLHFEGEVVAFVTTNKSGGAPSGGKKRWTELTLYRTNGGKFVAESVGVSTYKDEVNIISAEVFDKVEDALNFFRNKDGEFTWASNEMIMKVSEAYPDLVFNFGVSVD